MQEQHTMANKRVLVTGAGKGIGRALCTRLIALKSLVIAISRTQQDLDQLQKQGCYKVIQADLSSPQETAKAAQQAGDVDYLVNNAAITILQPFLETKPQNFRKVMSTNLDSVLILSQIIAKNMISRKFKGSIVNVSSLASTIAIANHSSYCASKAGLDHLSRVMALELGAHGITVNCVNPTVVMTNMGKLAWSDPVKAEGMLSRIPMGKFVEVQDVVQAIIFLLTAGMVNGHTLMIDGGASVAPFSNVKQQPKI